MNALTKKNAMVLSKDEYVKATNDIYKTALEDGVRQGIAACLLCLNMHYDWKEKRLSRFAGGVQDILKLPRYWAKTLTEIQLLNTREMNSASILMNLKWR